MADEQLSLLPKVEQDSRNCSLCQHFSELKIPRPLEHGGCIYGYCFKDGTKDHSIGLGKGYPVYIMLGACKDFKRERRSEIELRKLVEKVEEAYRNGER